MVNYIDYDKNDYSDDDFYYESKKYKVKRNKILVKFFINFTFEK